MCRVFSCVVGRECLLWPVPSLGRTLLVFALLHFVPQGQICLILQVSLDFQLLHSCPLWWKGHIFLVLVPKGLVGLHRTIQLQLLRHWWLGPRLRLLWYWMVCLGNEQRSSCCFWVTSINKRIQNAVLGWNLKNDRMISVCFQGKPFNITAIQVYDMSTNAKKLKLMGSMQTYKIF